MTAWKNTQHDSLLCESDTPPLASNHSATYQNKGKCYCAK